ncbi:hypothetical protein Clacol_005839 [Clathrus columnatus]|uniref:G domain-containing protein n=1 Tax=Clathrus columnatus TaxID=1419009 RepID=A0AAV5AFZ0_9AGAM|nr:hypothetical protein Clacol_005839 [Clathrus columnatus]
MFDFGNKRGERQQCFRILIIGRANAGKTTLLKHISSADMSEAPVYHKIRGRLSINPTESVIKPTDGRGLHDINQSFYFPSNPRFIFHDSPGFETGDESQLRQVQDFIIRRSKKWKIDEQLHAIWFCLLTNASRPLLELETRFFNEERPGNAFVYDLVVPVIAVFTKFDDLITQIYDPELGWQENRQVAEQILETRFRKPLLNFDFPPVACLTMEDMHTNTPLCRKQIKKLTEETAGSLSGSTLKLFVSTQRTNLELCLPNGDGCERDVWYDTAVIMSWFPHVPYSGYNLKIKIKLKQEHWHWICDLTEKTFGEDLFALQQSIQEYKISDSRRIIEAAIQELELKSQSILNEDNEKRLFELVLNNRLPPPPGLDIEP